METSPPVLKRPLRMAAVQIPWDLPGSDPASRMEANYATTAEWLEEAGRLGADIACLGETFNILGVNLTREEVRETVASAHAETVARLAPVARRHGMVIIAPILCLLDDCLRNVALVIDQDGTTAGQYLKVHCIEKERDLGVIPGDNWPVFKVAGAVMGIHICHDNSFPESARCLAMAGAEIIFWPHVMGGWGGEFMDILLRSPAIHNGVYHVPVCFGCPRDRAWQPGMLIGRSSIIGPDATILADAGRHPGIAIATIDLAAPRLATCFTRDGDYVWKVDMRNDRRPETYDLLTQSFARERPIPAKPSS